MKKFAKTLLPYALALGAATSNVACEEKADADISLPEIEQTAYNIVDNAFDNAEENVGMKNLVSDALTRGEFVVTKTDEFSALNMPVKLKTTQGAWVNSKNSSDTLALYFQTTEYRTFEKGTSSLAAQYTENTTFILLNNKAMTGTSEIALTRDSKTAYTADNRTSETTKKYDSFGW